MIPLSAQRAAHRTQWEKYIAAYPAAARFRLLSPTVRTNEPLKTRDMKVAGFEAMVALECHIVLPIGTPRPQEEKDLIDIRDESGELRTYTIVTVAPLRGDSCYRLGLRSRNKPPARTAPLLPRA